MPAIQAGNTGRAGTIHEEVTVAKAKANPLSSLRGDVERALEGIYERVGRHHHGVSGQIAEVEPPTDVSESGRGLTISLELAGVGPEDIVVEASAGWLSVSGSKERASEKQAGAYIVQELAYGRFEQRFALPDGADTDKIAATFKNGVLDIVVPLTTPPAPKTKRIAIKRT
jgi:HSP20 family protein